MILLVIFGILVLIGLTILGITIITSWVVLVKGLIERRRMNKAVKEGFAQGLSLSGDYGKFVRHSCSTCGKFRGLGVCQECEPPCPTPADEVDAWVPIEVKQ